VRVYSKRALELRRQRQEIHTSFDVGFRASEAKRAAAELRHLWGLVGSRRQPLLLPCPRSTDSGCVHDHSLVADGSCNIGFSREFAGLVAYL